MLKKSQMRRHMSLWVAVNPAYGRTKIGDMGKSKKTVSASIRANPSASWRTPCAASCSKHARSMSSVPSEASVTVALVTENEALQSSSRMTFIPTDGVGPLNSPHNTPSMYLRTEVVVLTRTCCPALQREAVQGVNQQQEA
eukprot:scaffold7214_cov114-Isochrysis_galbana.AAC.2